MSAKRNRAKQPPLRYASYGQDHWRADTSLVAWAQASKEFQLLITAAVNDRDTIIGSLPPAATENCALGREQALSAVIAYLKGFAVGLMPPASALTETYQPPENLPSDEWTDS